jgi:hypothetical protein
MFPRFEASAPANNEVRRGKTCRRRHRLLFALAPTSRRHRVVAGGGVLVGLTSRRLLMFTGTNASKRARWTEGGHDAEDDTANRKRSGWPRTGARSGAEAYAVAIAFRRAPEWAVRGQAPGLSGLPSPEPRLDLRQA